MRNYQARQFSIARRPCTLLCFLVLGSVGMVGCRSTLSPDKPSRLWEVFGRQTGRFFPRHDAPTPSTHMAPSPEAGVHMGPVNPTNPVAQPPVEPVYSVPAQPSGFPRSATMIPPLPREVR